MGAAARVVVASDSILCVDFELRIGNVFSNPPAEKIAFLSRIISTSYSLPVVLHLLSREHAHIFASQNVQTHHRRKNNARFESSSGRHIMARQSQAKPSHAIETVGFHHISMIIFTTFYSCLFRYIRTYKSRKKGRRHRLSSSTSRYQTYIN